MFWRRGKKSSGSQQHEGEDDIAKLQRQFGIKPVSDADVQAEFRSLFGGNAAGAAGATTGLSPASELLLLGGATAEDNDEAAILRALNISGTSVDGLELSDDDEEDGNDDGRNRHDAKRELGGVLREAHATAAQYQSQNDPMQMYANGQIRSSGDSAQQLGDREGAAARVQELKRQAIMLKREGNVKEALALFRQAKELQAQLDEAGESSTTAQPAAAVRVQTQHVVSRTVAAATPAAQQQRGREEYNDVTGDDDDDDVEVTEDDMQDPEFLAQLAKLGLAGDAHTQPEPREIVTIASIEAQIHEAKLQAVEHKRRNEIQDALQWMRKIKELEATLAQLKHAVAGASESVPTAVTRSVTVTRNGAAMASEQSADRIETAHAYTSAPMSVNTADEEAAQDSDVDVTEDDMDDPAFAEELRKLGFRPSDGDSSGKAGAGAGDGHQSSSAPIVSHSAATSGTPAFQSSLSIGDEDLIDAFDDEDDDDVPAYTPASSSSSAAATSGYGTLSTTEASVAHTLDSAPQQPRQDHPDLSDLEAQLQHAKETAIRLKREGNIKDALETMRRVKQIETLLEHKRQKQTSAAVVVQDPVTAAKFHDLEQLLVDFGNRALALAKENLSADRAKATEWLNKRKEYAAELDKLREKRQNPLQPPPSFRIEKLSREVEVELRDIPADHVVVTIHSVNELRAMAGRDVFVKFCLNFPSAMPHEGKTGTLRVSASAPYSTGKIAQQSQFRFPVQRSRGTQRLFEIKKAHFEVWTPATFLRSPELVARGYQELVPFLSTCQVSSSVPFVGSNRKPTGGNVEISIRLRTPLKDKEMKTETVEELRVGEYPAPLPLSSASPAGTPLNVSDGLSFAEIVKSDDPNAPPTASEEEAAAAEIAVEVDDPHHPDLIISYDVINEELEKIEAKLPSLQGQTAIELSDRFDSLSLKRQLLEIDMETGKLTLDMYVEKLHARIKDDRQLIARLMKSNRRMDAARVLHRVKIMEKELVGADGGGPEEAAPAT